MQITFAERMRLASRQASRSNTMSPLSIRPNDSIASRACRVDVVRSCGCFPACWSCNSCTSHSTSLSPPRPSLTCLAGSAPLGSRSDSTRALTRRISRTSVSASDSGYRIGLMSQRNSAANSSLPAMGCARNSAWASQMRDHRR
ncbi:hypothetical protein AHiyo1_33190 [Arthrobacter sp. Hiyo1]|nr:hypothetical protein AHiyo1_33190 [Arthrobacter sp. Hiyo1]